MSERRILISGIGGDIGQSTARAIGERLQRIGCDAVDVPVASVFVEHFERAPLADQVEPWFEWLREIIQQHSIDFFLPVPEPEIAILHAHRALADALPTKLLLSSPQVLSIGLDKLSTVEFLDAQGLPVPRSVLLAEYDGSFGFPVIVKHRRSWGGKRVHRVETHSELDALRAEDDGGLIAQEHLGSPEAEYTTGVFSDGAKVSTISFHRQLGYGGLTREARLVDEPMLDELARRVASALDLAGSINLQTRRVGAAFVPFEINPRISSTVGIRKHFGFDDVLWWVNLLEGRKHSFVPRAKSGYVLRYLVEAYAESDDSRG